MTLIPSDPTKSDTNPDPLVYIYLIQALIEQMTLLIGGGSQLAMDAMYGILKDSVADSFTENARDVLTAALSACNADNSLHQVARCLGLLCADCTNYERAERMLVNGGFSYLARILAAGSAVAVETGYLDVDNDEDPLVSTLALEMEGAAGLVESLCDLDWDSEQHSFRGLSQRFATTAFLRPLVVLMAECDCEVGRITAEALSSFCRSSDHAATAVEAGVMEGIARAIDMDVNGNELMNQLINQLTN